MTTIPELIERPRERITPLKWLRTNLFSSWYNSILTIICLTLIYLVLSQLLTWVFTQANWGVVTTNLRLFMIGLFPIEQVWRVWVCVALVTSLLGLSWGIWPQVIRGVAVAYGSALMLLTLFPFSSSTRVWLLVCGALIFGGFFLGRQFAAQSRWVVIGWVLTLPLIVYFLRGFGVLLPVIETREWGGLLLTMILSISGIVFSFPLGVLLAVGRRSSLPAISLFCTGYIELIRGVPLVTILFMSQIMLPLFIPGGEAIDSIVRAIVGFTLFTAAYIAENVRGGLQAVPNGQYEAARALGLNPFLTMSLIVMPQALRIVIPANVSQFVSLFKDTSLIAIASQLDLLGIGRAVLGQDEFLGLQAEVFVFVAAMYWVFAFSMTYVSRQLESALGVGKR
ncbi:MAG: ABC-type amino acid transport system, permease component [Chloroflexi bacterium AL-N10]|nr:ABC-type amino acid transport system, permease component [Chloroflexi bacterium AL-N1]NOK66705.1 ABC-type amino acid transport system, permease component [Chloroflexi bacterium AL-N10]NOK72093.1 ABC-type amino acid transport system, permease component [Chloroflexi bacterium AL-N5]